MNLFNLYLHNGSPSLHNCCNQFSLEKQVENTHLFAGYMGQATDTKLIKFGRSIPLKPAIKADHVHVLESSMVVLVQMAEYHHIQLLVTPASLTSLIRKMKDAA